jgi:hypothetical protein
VGCERISECGKQRRAKTEDTGGRFAAENQMAEIGLDRGIGFLDGRQKGDITMGLTVTNLVQPVGKRVFGTRGGTDNLPVVDNKLVPVGCVFALWNGFKRSDKLDG